MADEKDPKDIETGKETQTGTGKSSDSTASDKTASESTTSDKSVTDSTPAAESVSDKAVSEKPVPEKAASEKPVPEEAVSDTVVSGEKPYDPISPDPEQPAAVGASVTDPAVPLSYGAKAKGKGPSKVLLGVLGGLLGLLLIAALTAAVVFGLAWHGNKVDRDAQNEAKAAACAFAPTLAGYDYKDFDSYIKNVLAGSTGEFKKEFGDSSKELKDFLVQGQVKATVAQSQCGVASGDKNHAEIVMVIAQTITSVATNGQPQPSQLGMVASMDKVDGRWVVSKMGTSIKPE